MNAIIVEFAEISKNKDITGLEKLLCDNGIFQIQDANLETIEVGKNEFLEWYQQKLNFYSIYKIEFDKCNQCSVGSPVIIFNEGTFPRSIKDHSERSKTGLMLEFIDNQISFIKFCFIFQHIENKYIFECNAAKIRELMNQGMTFEQAFAKFF